MARVPVLAGTPASYPYSRFHSAPWIGDEKPRIGSPRATDGMQLTNRTCLDTDRMLAMMRAALDGWPQRGLRVFVRYSRGADFSGTCYYKQSMIYVNLGRHLRYPYLLGTSVARSRSNARYWWKPVYSLELSDGYGVVMFVFLHEVYHWLVHRARRNPRQKESMCDRFASRMLVDRFGATMLDDRGRPVPRHAWDIQDVESFVAAACPKPRVPRIKNPAIPDEPEIPAATITTTPSSTPSIGRPKAAVRPASNEPAPHQLLLFEL